MLLANFSIFFGKPVTNVVSKYAQPVVLCKPINKGFLETLKICCW